MTDADTVERTDEETPVEQPILLRSDAQGVAGLTLNRPDAYNALSRAMLEALEREIDAIASDGSIQVVVITGTGRAFCAGHDLKEIRGELTPEVVRELFTLCSRIMVKLTRLPQPVIALIDGIATAAGCQLVAACDLALATSNARFATSGIKYGFFCSTPMVALSRNVPRKPALEMLFTGDFIEADDAWRLGLVNRVVPPEKLEEAFEDLVGRLLDKPKDVLALGKRAFYEQSTMGLEEAYAYTTDVMVENTEKRAFKEGMDAFAEKRAPVWPDGG
jgi:enoyl-CoA hydratase/carnithine racemase